MNEESQTVEDLKTILKILTSLQKCNLQCIGSNSIKITELIEKVTLRILEVDKI